MHAIPFIIIEIETETNYIATLTETFICLACPGLNVSFHVPIVFTTAELASGAAVHVAADKRSVMIPAFVVADAIILRS